MQTFGLVLCIPSTTPPGPVGTALRRGFERAYLPLIETLWDIPEIRVSMHWSGALLEWMEAYAPDHLKMLQELVVAGRVEILGGLFGAGLLPALPERDVIGQLQKNFAWWKAHGDPRIRGAWLPHCAWDPSASRILGQMGLRYTVLEPTQVHHEGPVDGYLLTEREGNTLGIFVADERLGRMIPDAAPSRIITELDQRAQAGLRCVTIVVPGERFGAALDASATRCFGGGRGWVRRFFRSLVDNSHWLKMVDFGTVLDRMHPAARSYPPSSIGLSVSIAALGGDLGNRYADYLNRLHRGEVQNLGPLVTGASWERLLALHPELNRLHKKMLRTSVEVFRLRNTIRDRVRRGMEVQALEDALQEALDALYRAQHGSAYVLGTEVGAQDGGVRHEAWSSLLRAEYAVASALGDAEQVRIVSVDHDCDGRHEVILRTAQLAAVIAPGMGGALSELNVWSLPGNLINVWTRREEPFHRSLLLGEDLPLLVEDDEDSEGTDVGIHPPPPPYVAALPVVEFGLEQKLHYDRYIRACFQDRFLGSTADLEAFRAGTAQEAGDFLMSDWLLEDQRIDDEGAHLYLSRDGNATEGAAVRFARIVKHYHFSKQRKQLHVHYEVANAWHDPVRGRFGVEFNLNLDSSIGNGIELEVLAQEASPQHLSVESCNEIAGIREFALVDHLRGMRVQLTFQTTFNGSAHLWHYPIETVSRTPAGLGRLFQGVCLLIWWPIELWSLEHRSIDFTLTVDG